MSLPIAVLISGGGSNLQALIDRIEQGSLQASIQVVVSNVPRAKGLERAEKHGIACRVVPQAEYSSRQAHDRAVIAILHSFGVQAVCLAGYMRLISPEFVQAFPNRVLNIHPSLLPSFPGLHAQNQAVDYGVRVSGATVHFVDQELDHGPIIIQGSVPLYPEDAEEEAARRILALEHRIYPQAVQWMAEDRLRIAQGRVHVLSSHSEPADTSSVFPCLINPGLELGF
ncbi:phosphoribosylglycinamide formyltransferase [Desulfovermiculus halophilus]|uniref:phosphoribosylglycinamide formyltransferase n=1 Tax=Desulfovermiculus halophilus TaxID=339722 RepID=UPI0004882983|nr:phosphoribosylglycinamide formyltransferase [Desulfovermiculus halophilus]